MNTISGSHTSSFLDLDDTNIASKGWRPPKTKSSFMQAILKEKQLYKRIIRLTFISQHTHNTRLPS